MPAAVVAYMYEKAYAAKGGAGIWKIPSPRRTIVTRYLGGILRPLCTWQGCIRH